MICLHNECGLCFTAIRFTIAYICTTAWWTSGCDDDIFDWLECLINISGGGVGLHAVLTLIKKSSRILFYMSLELMQ